MSTLVFDLEDGHQVVVPLDIKVTLGSAEGNDVLIEEKGIDKFHAEIFQSEENDYWVRDLNSTRGTLVNGNRVSLHMLRAGDSLAFGPLKGRFITDETAVKSETENVAVTAKVEVHQAELERRTKEKTDELTRLEKRLAEAQAAFETLQARAKISEAEAQKKQQTFAETYVLEQEKHRHLISAATQEHAELVQKNVQAKQDFEIERGTFAEKITALKAEHNSLISKKENLAQESQQLAKDLVSQKSAAEELREEKAKLAAENETLKENVSTQKSEATRLLGENENLLKKIADSKVTFEAQEAKRAEIQKAVEELEVQNQTLSAENVRLKNQQTEQQIENEKLQTSATGLRTGIAELERKQNELNVRHQEALLKLSSLQIDVEAATNQREELSKNVQTLEEKRSVAQAENVALVAASAKVSAELADLSKSKETLQAETKTLQENVKAAENRLAELGDTEKRLTAVREELLTASAEQATLSAVIATLMTQRHEDTEKSAEIQKRLEELQTQRTQAEQDFAAIQEKLSTAEKTFADQQKETSQLRREAEDLKGVLSLGRAQLSAATNNLERIQREHTALENKTRDLDAKTLHLAEIQAFLSEGDNLWEEREKELERRYVEDQEEVVRQFNELQATKAEVLKMRAAETALQESLKALQTLEDQERQGIIELRQAREELEMQAGFERKQLQASIEEMRQELASIETRLLPLQFWKEELDDRYAKLALMPVDAEESRLYWQETQQRKDAIAEQLNPVGIQPRLVSRGQVVPRAKRL